MATKLEDNGLWESCRMILPEHKLRMQENRKELNRRQRIELDEQAWEDISRAVGESLQQRRLITLKMYHEYEELQIIGVVHQIDPIKKRFLVNGDWFPIKDIEGAYLEGN